ncbi:MAG: LUD domain-containing protein [Weeksellaceae bacterium]
MANFWSKLKDFFQPEMEEENQEDIDLSYSKPMPLDEKFVNYFVQAKGNFLYCESERELLVNLKNIKKEEQISRFVCFDEKLQTYLNTIGATFIDYPSATADFSFLTCESLVAHNGSIMLSSEVSGGRKLSDLPDNFIICAYYNQIVDQLGDGLQKILSRRRNKSMPSGITSIGGVDANPMENEPIKKTIYLLLLD